MADMDFVEVGALDGQSLVPQEDDELDWILIGDERGAHTPDVLMYDEILLRILHFAMLFDKPHPPENCADQDTGLSCGRCLGFIRASHVCHRWRKIALATPSLWIRDAFVLFHTDAMRTIFRRAQDLPLDLDVNVRDEMDITELPLRRARKLNILRTSRNTWNRQAMLVKMAMHVCSSYDNDMLEDVSISFPPVVFNRTLTAQTQFPTLFAPLRALRTENICFPWSSPSLTYLSVHGFANPRLTPSAGLFLSCLSASPKLEVISISSFLPSLGMTEKTGPYTIMLPKLKILQIHDLAELSLMLLSRFILPADVYIEVDMESTKETPLLAHFDAAIQPHIQNFLSLDYFCSLAVITDPVLSISVLPIGFEKSRTSHGRSRRGGLQGKDWKWFADADEWPGPGVIIRSTIAGSGTVSFLDYMAFASYLLFPHTPRVLSLDITPNVDMMPAQWMDSLDPFTAVDTISFPAPGRALLSRNLLRALELRPTRILPNLTSLMVKFEAPPAEFEGLDDTRVAKNELEELIELITGVVVSRLQTGRDAVIGSIHLTGRNDDADSLMKLADRLSVYVPETDVVSVEEHSI